MIIVKATQKMIEYLQSIKVSEYQVISEEIHISLNAQQLWYRMSAGNPHITMENSESYSILHFKIFKQ